VTSAGSVDCSRLSSPAAQVRTTAMSPEVNVRVLSVQTTVVDPSDSTAGSLRTSALRAAMRCRPTASAMAATAGSASGTAATASAMPVSMMMSSGAPWSAASRAQLGRDPDAGVHRQDRRDCRRLDCISENQGHHARRDQKQDDDAVKLVQENSKGGYTRRWRKAIWSVLRQSLRGFGSRSPVFVESRAASTSAAPRACQRGDSTR
jgi:hypothetical protein